MPSSGLEGIVGRGMYDVDTVCSGWRGGGVWRRSVVASGKEDIDQEGGRGKRKIMRGD